MYDMFQVLIFEATDTSKGMYAVWDPDQGGKGQGGTEEAVRRQQIVEGEFL